MKVYDVEGEGHKCSHVDAENTNIFVVFQDSGIPNI